MSTPAGTGRKGMVTMGMVIVAGHLVVDPEGRAAYLEGCREVVDLARRTEGCLDFAITADLLDPARVNVYERWESQEAVEAFRGEAGTEVRAQRASKGPSGEQQDIRSGSVAEYGAVEEQVLFG